MPLGDRQNFPDKPVRACKFAQPSSNHPWKSPSAANVACIDTPKRDTSCPPPQGLLKRICTHSKPAASGRGLPPEDASTLLETSLFAAARGGDARAAAAATSAFQYLLHVAQGSSAGPSPQVGAPFTFGRTAPIDVHYAAVVVSNRHCSFDYY